MAPLPDPTEHLDEAGRAEMARMAAARAHAEGAAALGQVYVRMFNNPEVATLVGALGEHLRFHGVLPDDVRELAIVRLAARRHLGYEWSHHQRPAHLAGVADDVLAAVTAGEVPASLDPAVAAALGAVDAVAEQRSIPGQLQARLIDAYGTAGVVELVALCGLYGLIGAMVVAFDIDLEDGLPLPPF